MPPPTGADCSHALSSSHYVWTLAQDGDPMACPGNLLPGRATVLRTTYALTAASPFASCVPTLLVCACWDSPVPSSLPSPLQQPLAVVYCLFSLWCLISPQAKCQIIGQSHHYHPAMKKSEILNRLPKERY